MIPTNLYSISLFSDSLYINQLLQITRNTGIVYFQSFPLSYIPASGRCYHWSTPRRQMNKVSVSPSGIVVENTPWYWPCSGDVREALLLSTASLRVTGDLFQQMHQKQRGQCSPSLHRHSSRSPVSELSQQKTTFYTIQIGFEHLETINSSISLQYYALCCICQA